MKYFYNYSFLTNWMEANRDITNKQIMKAMGTTSNTGLDSWIRMKSPLPTIALLRFCNAFHVPLSAFIVDADDDGNCEKEHVYPSVNDQFEPDGGYINNDAKRQLGTRALRNPLDVDHIKSVVPGWTSDRIAGNGGDKETDKEVLRTAAASTPTVEAEKQMAADKEPLTAADKETLTAADKTEPDISMAMLNRMLDIIAEQQKQIGDQQKLIGELTRRLDSQQQNYMVAEEIHRNKE